MVRIRDFWATCPCFAAKHYSVSSYARLTRPGSRRSFLTLAEQHENPQRNDYDYLISCLAAYLRVYGFTTVQRICSRERDSRITCCQPGVMATCAGYLVHPSHGVNPLSTQSSYVSSSTRLLGTGTTSNEPYVVLHRVDSTRASSMAGTWLGPLSSPTSHKGGALRSACGDILDQYTIALRRKHDRFCRLPPALPHHTRGCPVP